VWGFAVPGGALT